MTLPVRRALMTVALLLLVVVVGWLIYVGLFQLSVGGGDEVVQQSEAVATPG